MFDVMDEQTVTYTYDSEAPILTSVTPPNESILHAVEMTACSAIDICDRFEA